MGLVGTSETEDYKVKVTPGENEGEVNITFSGFTFPVMPFSFEEFTIPATATENADGTITYTADPTTIYTGGGMPAPYNVTLEGEAASADATPVFHLVARNATTDDVWFGADKEAIDAYKEKLTTIDVDGTRVPIAGNVDVAVDVTEKVAYSGDTANFNVDDVLAFFAEGTTMADVTTYWLNPDNTTVTPVYGGGTIDGWRNADGFPAMWADCTNGMCVKLSDPASGLFDYIGAHDGNFEAGDNYVARFAFVKDNQAVVLALTINFVKPAAVELTISDTKIQKEVDYTDDPGNYTQRIVTLTDEEVAKILEVLALESLDDAEWYGYNPTTGELQYYSVVAPFDGWRNAEGDFTSHTGNAETAPVCVKPIGADDVSEGFPCYNIQGATGTVSTYWALANETTAVLVQIDVIFPKPAYEFVAEEWQAGDPGRISADNVTYNEDGTITVDKDGANNVNLQYKGTNEYLVSADNKYFTITASGISTADGASYLWWLNNNNNGTQIAPTEIVENEDGTVTLIWDLSQVAIAGTLGTEDTVFYNAGGWSTCFGLTLADNAVPAVVSNIGFMTEEEKEAVGINGINIADNAMRSLEDALANGRVFDLSGRQIRTITTGGIYIVNGRKMAIHK